MNTRKYITRKRSILYILSGFLLLFAVAISLITWYSAEIKVGAVASSFPFVMLGVLGFTYLLLTQETATKEPMTLKRTLWYVLAIGVLLFGVLSSIISYYGVEAGLADTTNNSAPTKETGALAAVSILMVISLPALTLLAYLIMTEKSRIKSWAIKETEEFKTSTSTALVQKRKLALMSGAIWILAIAVFGLIALTGGLKYAWIALVTGLAGQLIVIALLGNKKHC